MFNIFGASATVNIEFDDATDRKKVGVPKQGGKSSAVDMVPVFDSREKVSGRVVVSTSKGKRVEHLGCKLELLGRIEFYYESGSRFDFVSCTRDIEPPGAMTGDKIFPFDFSNVEKLYESYNGINVKLRYFLKFTMTRSMAANIVKEQDFFVQIIQPEPEVNTPIRLEVGIEDCLHIEFEYTKSKYHLKDVIFGKIMFLLVRIKIKHMELTILRKESTGSGSNLYNESENITKFEVMDGAPVRGEVIPIRLFLSGFDLTPTYRAINNRFTVKYFLNLVLVDEEDRRYFKQQEITLWRKRL